MSNELLLIGSMLLLYTTSVLVYRAFGEYGLCALNILFVLASNIEVCVLVRAFGVEMTLGNIGFAATFLITDILSENNGEKSAKRAVNIGIWCSVLFIGFARSWFLYTPSATDTMLPILRAAFASTPRVICASLLVYIIVQKLDIFLYHRIWKLTERIGGSKKRFLWLRNNGATLISQLFNSFLFNFAAFYGVFDLHTLLTISLSGYCIYVVTSLCDTPFVYWARRLKYKEGHTYGEGKA